jgi:catechol 2,3-dioxygenase-like lactoylglutathione lyase family enzyme
MSGLTGVNHIAFLTCDINRLAAFYEEVFGAAKVLDLPIPEPEGPGRHALISIGSGASLHAFEFSRIAPPPAAPMFQRGRIDHFALNVRDAQTIEQLRTKLLERGSTDGTVTEFGVMRVLTFTDPDGHSLELAHWIGGRDPSDIDMSVATDGQRSGQRTAASRSSLSRRRSLPP